MRPAGGGPELALPAVAFVPYNYLASNAGVSGPPSPLFLPLLFRPRRNMNTIRLIALAITLCVVGALACGSDTTTNTEPIDVTTFFDLNVDGQPLILNNLGYTNSSGTAYSIKTLRFVLTDIVLHDDAGESSKIADLYYYDLADASTQSFKFTGLPHANWTSVSFTFGLDATDNVRDKYIAKTQFHLAMQWPEILGANLGYHYMQLEGDYATGPSTTSPYTTHMGPRQLDGTNPDFPNVVDPTPYHFDFAVSLPVTPTHIHNGGHGELTIHFNLNDWYKDSDAADGLDTEYDFSDYPTQAIMGNLDAQGKLQANGRFCFSATLVAHGGHHDS